MELLGKRRRRDGAAKLCQHRTPVSRDAGRDRRFGADAKRAEKLGVTVGLELVEEQFGRHIEWQEQQHRLVAAAREAVYHVTHDPDPQVQAAGLTARGWRPSVNRPGRARSTDRGGQPASDGV